MSVDDNATIRQSLVHHPPVSPRRRPQTHDMTIGEGVDLVPGLSPGLQIDAGVEGARPGFPKGGGEGSLEGEWPGQVGVGGRDTGRRQRQRRATKE